MMMTMMTPALALALVACAAAAAGAAGSVSAAAVPCGPTDYCRVAPVREIDLDAPAEERFVALTREFAPVLAEAGGLIRAFLPASLRTLAEDLAAAADSVLQAPYGEELRGVARGSGLSLGEAVLLNVIYSVEAGCTSVVTTDKAGPGVLHGRNLDFNLAPVLRNMTVQLHFMRGGKLAYAVPSYAGLVGALTGVKPGVFSVSLDQRSAGTLWENLLEALFRGGEDPTFLLRNTLEAATSYGAAVKALSSTHIIAPAYLIVGGTQGAGANQGAVITRDRNSAADVWPLNWTGSAAAPDRKEPLPGWFRVETNYDHWKPAGDSRRRTANDGLLALGRGKVDRAGLWKVLSTPEVLNSGTTYTALMNAHDGTCITYARTYTTD